MNLILRTLQVRDADGLDRFKSGFFVDDFADSERMEEDSEAGTLNNELKSPIDYSSIKPEVAAANSVDDQFDLDFQLLDPNVRKTGDLITLNYSDKSWIEQPLASRVENVNPFNMIDFTGRIQLTPASQDNWVRTITTEIFTGRSVDRAGRRLRTRSRRALASWQKLTIDKIGFPWW